MHELAALTEGADTILVESVAGSGHEVLGHVGLFHKLVLTMGVGALVTPSTGAVHLPVLAHLSLLLELVLLLAIVVLGDPLGVERFGGG